MAQPHSLLVVDDDTAMREMLASLFREKGYPVEEAASADEALERAREVEFDAVLSDVRMPGRSGVELVGELRRFRPGVPVVLMTAFGSVDAAVDAMRAGAFDYITKPFEPEAVMVTLERALEHRELEEENRRLRRAVATSTSLGDLRGESPALAEIVAMIKKVAGGSSSVLITGESGTGKEVVARTLHYQGARKDAPFVPINCTALPEGLLESELFGHVRGAFTGAHTSKRGLFEKANGGTLFLDEIGDMGPALQGKLLRVLQDREIRPVGGNSSVKVDVRIVAATNKELDKEMEAGRFREDLYYRLNVIPIHIPPLRERPEDIPTLVKVFLRRHADGEGRGISPEAVRHLAAQPWRGNARELENYIERALALSDSPQIGLADLHVGEHEAPPAAASLDAGVREAADAGLTLRELEERYTDMILQRTGGNKLRAAKILGIDRKTLYRRAERRRAVET
ncbi:MAG: sigma-54-dependent Fis family transcriptional regulator [Deltaproteobacteria bacterium]|nr:sigma-54-dependent Fis family transcriptional regulator [Deltaproteobacteria bacterium]MBW2360559.1 sigma-54-dependent Fis family transcriptional regulator [Deltaproteobacteria bacterium]